MSDTGKTRGVYTGQFIVNSDLQLVARQQAAQHYRTGNKARWKSALWCSKVVGKYERGATVGLAQDMGVSVDTIENMAHAYMMYDELWREPKFRYAAVIARRSQHIYYSHFRALYDAWTGYNLTLHQVHDLIIDIYQGEGDISSRDVDRHARERYGVVNYLRELRRLRKSAIRALENKRLAKPDRRQLKKLIATLEKRIGE